MKPIIVKETNKERIQQELDVLQKRSKVRTIDAGDILKACSRIEKELNVTKKALVGTVAIVDPNAQDFPKAYKYTPESTSFRIVRTSTGWKLTDLYRDSCARSDNRYIVTIPEEAKQEILHRFERFW